MRVHQHCHTISISMIASVLPILLVSLPLQADTFFWTGSGSTSWTSSTNWSGPAGLYPDWWPDNAYVNGATNNPIVNTNIVIGFLVIQNAGHVSAGGNNPLSSLVVTSNGGLSGNAIIKHAGSKLIVRGSSNYRDFQCETLDIQNGAMLCLRENATIQADVRLLLKAGAVLVGNGEFDFSQTGGTIDPYNDGLIHSRFGTLRFYNSGSSVAVFDLDGPSEDGQIEAWGNSTLIIDTLIETEFNGTMAINANAELRIAEDWTLSDEAGSVLAFFGGAPAEPAILSGGSATLLGSVYVVSGESSLAAPTTIGSTAEIDLAAGATLRVDDTLVIDAGATFTGTGDVRVSDGTQLELAGGLLTSLTVINDGVLAVGGAGLGTSLVSNYEQGSTGRCEFDLCRNGGGEVIVEQLIASGSVVLDGELDLNPLSSCEPSPGDEFTIITAASVTGTFATVTGLPDVELIYAADSVTVRVPTLCPADIDDDGMVGINDFLTLLSVWGICGGCPADIDGDGMVGINDFLTLLAVWGPC